MDIAATLPSPTSPAPGADALPARESKAGADGAPLLDPRVVLLLDECFRHGKALAAWGDGVSALEAAGVAGAPGVVSTDSATGALEEVVTLLGAHRVWERFATEVG